MVYEQKLGKDLKGSGRDLIKVRSRYLTGRPEENHENPSVRAIDVSAEI
jgi:hypothetical protein